MTMGWMETIRLIGFDLQVAMILVVGSIRFTQRALASTWESPPVRRVLAGFAPHRKLAVGDDSARQAPSSFPTTSTPVTARTTGARTSTCATCKPA